MNWFLSNVKSPQSCRVFFAGSFRQETGEIRGLFRTFSVKLFQWEAWSASSSASAPLQYFRNSSAFTTSTVVSGRRKVCAPSVTINTVPVNCRLHPEQQTTTATASTHTPERILFFIGMLPEKIFPTMKPLFAPCRGEIAECITAPERFPSLRRRDRRGRFRRGRFRRGRGRGSRRGLLLRQRARPYSSLGSASVGLDSVELALVIVGFSRLGGSIRCPCSRASPRASNVSPMSFPSSAVIVA